MSENFIRRLSERIVTHPDFQKQLQGAVADVITAELAEFAGQEVCFYIPKITQNARAERTRKARAMLDLGMTPEQVAKAVGLSVRHVRRLRGTSSPLNMSA